MAAVSGSQRICRIKVGNEEHTVSALSLHWLEVRPQGNVVGKAWRQEDHPWGEEQGASALFRVHSQKVSGSQLVLCGWVTELTSVSGSGYILGAFICAQPTTVTDGFPHLPASTSSLVFQLRMEALGRWLKAESSRRTPSFLLLFPHMYTKTFKPAYT